MHFPKGHSPNEHYPNSSLFWPMHKVIHVPRPAYIDVGFYDQFIEIHTFCLFGNGSHASPSMVLFWHWWRLLFGDFLGLNLKNKFIFLQDLIFRFYLIHKINMKNDFTYFNFYFLIFLFALNFIALATAWNLT